MSLSMVPSISLVLYFHTHMPVNTLVALAVRVWLDATATSTFLATVLTLNRGPHRPFAEELVSPVCARVTSLSVKRVAWIALTGILNGSMLRAGLISILAKRRAGMISFVPCFALAGK